MQFLLAIDIHT